MPILKQGATTSVAPPPTNFIDRIRAGRVVPIISDEACFDLALHGHGAFLAHYAAYAGYPLAGIPNDPALMQRALRHQDFAPEEIQTIGDEAGPLAGLRQVLATIWEDFADVADDGMGHHCFFYFSGSGWMDVDKKAYLRFSTIFTATVGTRKHSAPHRVWNRCCH